jgi:outer membrane protein assembly factor BamB
VAPTITCGSQRPGINVAPAIAPDGTVYTISRTHFNDRWGYLVAVNGDLTAKWTASLRNRFHDGCNVAIPPNGSAGGCRAGAITGVDPADNLPGSGRINDNGTSSPAVGPDGRIFYGSFTRYNYSQGHLMAFDPDGSYVGTYGWGWDLTPAIYRHDGTYSLLLKENHYNAPPYCNDHVASCPGNRTLTTPNDPEQYFITQLSRDLAVEWRFKNTETKSCVRIDGAIQCQEDHPNGFEWCVNAVAVDARGVVYANAEDGNVYAIDQGGLLRQRLFLNLALGAAYTPLSIGGDGRIYTQNNGVMFAVGAANTQRRRAAGR